MLQAINTSSILRYTCFSSNHNTLNLGIFTKKGIYNVLPKVTQFIENPFSFSLSAFRLINFLGSIIHLFKIKMRVHTYIQYLHHKFDALSVKGIYLICVYIALQKT